MNLGKEESEGKNLIHIYQILKTEFYSLRLDQTKNEDSYEIGQLIERIKKYLADGFFFSY